MGTVVSCILWGSWDRAFFFGFFGGVLFMPCVVCPGALFVGEGG